MIVGVVGSAIMGIGYGHIWPVMETFRAISIEGIPVHMRLIKCFTVIIYLSFFSMWF